MTATLPTFDPRDVLTYPLRSVDTEILRERLTVELSIAEHEPSTVAAQTATLVVGHILRELAIRNARATKRLDADLEADRERVRHVVRGVLGLASVDAAGGSIDIEHVVSRVAERLVPGEDAEPAPDTREV